MASTPGTDPIYTTIKSVFELMNLYSPIVSEAVGTGAGVVKVFSLGHRIVVNGSLSVYVGGSLKTETTDYTVDYDKGVITFVSAPTGAITADYWYSEIRSDYVKEHILAAEDDLNRRVGRSFYPAQTRIDFIDGEKTVDINWYYYNNTSFREQSEDFKPQQFWPYMGKSIFLPSYPIISVSSIYLDPAYVNPETVGTGNGSNKSFFLDNSVVVENSEHIYINSVEKTRTTDYSINLTTGEITFVSAPVLGATVTADYWYGGLVDKDKYFVYGDVGRIVFPDNYISFGLKKVVVNYTYGYSTVPRVVKRICELICVASMLRQRFMGAPVPQDVLAMNLTALTTESDRMLESLGTKFEVLVS